MRRTLPFVLMLCAGACAPGTLGSNDPGPDPTPPPPQPLTSCGDGKIDATGFTDTGPFVATAISVRGTACDGSTEVVVEIAGNNAAAWDLRFDLEAKFLEGGGLRVPLGQQVASTTLQGGRAQVTVDITASDDAYWRPDSGAVARLEGSFEEYNGNRTIKGMFSCPFCNGIRPCAIDTP